MTPDELENGGGRFGNPFDQAEKRRPSSQHCRQKEGEERIDHLAGDIGQEADQTQDQHIAGNALEWVFHRMLKIRKTN